jgi:CNT family concentrative nucleoside transporter
MIHRYIGILGLVLILLIAYGFSNSRRQIKPWIIVWGLLLQFAFALLIMKTSVGVAVFGWMANMVTVGLAKAEAGAVFVFGDFLMDENSVGYVFAVKALPTIIYVSSLFGILYYLGLLQKVVLFMAKIMARTMGTSGAESLSCAANVFMGQTEAPLLIAPYVQTMTYSELSTVMIGGMATIAGGVMAAYIAMGVQAKFLLAASIMNAPAALLISKMLVPETGTPLTRGEVKLKVEISDVNFIDAAARGAGVGLKLALNVAAMLIAFLSIIALINWPLNEIGAALGFELSLERIFAWIFSPLAFVMGVPWEEAGKVGTLLGQKLILNEFVSYLGLTRMKAAGALSPRAELIASYALCGFANLGSIGIQLGGIGGLAPSRKQDMAKLGLRALLGGSLATFMTATIAGLLNA